MRTLIDGRRLLVALFAGLLLLAVATSAEAEQRVVNPASPTAGMPSTAGAVQAAQAQSGYEGGSTGQGPADDAECESYANRINVLIDQLPSTTRPAGPTTRTGISATASPNSRPRPKTAGASSCTDAAVSSSPIRASWRSTPPCAGHRVAGVDPRPVVLERGAGEARRGSRGGPRRSTGFGVRRLPRCPR